MRLSMDEKDRAYDPYKAIWATVYLDGVEVKNCLIADEEAGECICLDVDYVGQSELPRVLRLGKVEIVLA